MRQYDFTSAPAKKKLKQIVSYIQRASRGRTLKQIAESLTMSMSGAAPYVTHLCDEKVIHIAEEAKAKQRGHTAAIYQFGARPFVERRRKAAYMNDTLLAHFFGENFHEHR